MSQTTTPPNAPEKVIADPVTETGEGVLDLMRKVKKSLERFDFWSWAKVQDHAINAVAALLTREAALVAERDALRDVAAAYEVARQEIFDHCLSNGVFNAWGKAMDCTSLNDAHMLARNSDGGTRAIAAERDALAAEVVALRENAAAERNRGIMDAQGLLHEVSSKHRSAAATAYAQELLNALMQKYAETQAAARAPATIGGDAT